MPAIKQLRAEIEVNAIGDGICAYGASIGRIESRTRHFRERILRLVLSLIRKLSPSMNQLRIRVFDDRTLYGVWHAEFVQGRCPVEPVCA